jgi:hypothetical protein
MSLCGCAVLALGATTMAKPKPKTISQPEYYPKYVKNRNLFEYYPKYVKGRIAEPEYMWHHGLGRWVCEIYAGLAYYSLTWHYGP